jgi:cobalamin biosynthesis Mg chelatase CobN
MLVGGIALSLRIRSLLVPLALFVLSVSALASARPAGAATCWQRVLSDWKDGRIDGTYSASCLRAALVNMPEDLRIYGDAADDITRLLNGIQARKLAAAQAAASTKTAATTTTASAAEAEPAAGSRSLSGRKAKPKRESVQRVAAASKGQSEPGGGLPYRTMILILAAVAAVSVVGVASVRGLRR